MKLPLEAFEQHIAIIGKTGSGKTYAAKGMVETLLSQGRRVCVLDPTGAWWGLKSSESGTAPGFPVVIFGGDHADIPITEKSGRALGEFIAQSSVPAIIDLSELFTNASHRFVADFAETLYTKNKAPLHLIVDEADEFAPQRPMPDSRVMLNRMDRIVRRGRIKGFRVMMISQRPAVLNKDVLTQANTLCAMRLMGPQDRSAIQEWIKGQADETQGKAVIASLPKLKKGESWIWSPELDILDRAKFPRIKTFDSSRAPEPGENRTIVEIADVDLASIREHFTEAEEAARENDPKALKARIRELEKQVGKKAPAIDMQAVERAREEGRQEGLRAGEAAAREFASEVTEKLRELADGLKAPVFSSPDPVPVPFAALCEDEMTDETIELPPKWTGEDIQPRHQKIIDAIAWFQEVGIPKPSRRQVAFVAGQSVKSSSFTNNLSHLRTSGYINYPTTGCLSLTEAGVNISRTPLKPPTTEELQRRIFEKLEPRHAKILRITIDAYPESIGKSKLADAVEQSSTSSSFSNNLSLLRTLGLIDYPIPGSVVATDLLFL